MEGFIAGQSGRAVLAQKGRVAIVGRRALTSRARDQLAKLVRLPENFYIPTPSVEPNARHLELIRIARLCGWVGALAEHPLLTKIMACSSGNRVNNALKIQDLPILAQRASPGRTEAFARKVIWRANAILAPYGLRVSYAAVWRSLVDGSRRVGKAAIRAAGLTIAGFFDRLISWKDALIQGRGMAEFLRTIPKEYRKSMIRMGVVEATEWFRKRYNGKYLLGETTEKFGVKFAKVLDSDYIFEKGILVTYKSREYFFEGSLEYTSYRKLLAKARREWADQDYKEELLMLLEGRHPDFSALVTIKDSMAMGYCEEGTLEWAQKHGFGVVAPMAKVWATGDYRARGICKYVAWRLSSPMYL